MPSALLFAAHKFSDEEIDLVLQSGGSDPGSRMRIATEFSKGKSRAELAAFLQKDYRGGKGLVTGEGKVSAWFDADGVRLARGDAARYVSSARLVPWDDVVRRIDRLLERGMYATMDERHLAGRQERTEIAQSLGYLRQDLSDEAVSRGLLPTLGERSIPFQDNVEKYAALLEQPEARQAIANELRAFVEAYDKEHALLRFHLHPPGELLRRVEELALPRKAYPSELLEPPALPGFITQDEIDSALAQGSLMAGGKGRIHAYLAQAHTSKEKADYLKREYGIGGRSHALFGVAESWEEHDGKGICLRKNGCENVLLRWPEVTRRIEALIRQNRYLTPEELEQAEPRKRESRVTQKDINQAIQEWNGDPASKRAVVRRLREEASPNERLAILREEYGDGLPSFPVNGENGADDLPWEEVLNRVLTLIAEDRFFTEEEQDRLEDIDPIHIRKRLEESGLVGGEVATPEKLAQEPFIRQVEATAARMVQEETEQEIYDQYLPIIKNLVLADSAYQNACKNSDRENAYLEGEAAIKRAASTIRDTRFIRLYGDLGVFQAKLRRDLLETTYSELAGQPVPQAPSYRVGDTVYLDDRPFEITEIRGNSIQLLDHALSYPIFRLERRETFENLLMLDPRNHALMEAPSKETPASEGDVTVPPQAREETAYVYPAEENHLPYDVVINRLHVEEAELEAPSTPQAAPENFRITDDHLGEGGQKTKYGHNVAAIRTLQTIEAENRYATPEEQEILSHYVGWGGIPQAFDGQNADWGKEYAELKELLPEAEYASARASTLNAHYTSPTVIHAIYDTIARLGFTTGNILEPACGVGNFFGLLPEEMQKSRLYGVELDSITGRIAKQLYPNADITVAGFETTNRRDFYDLAVGNVPFGNYQVQDRAYDKLRFNIHDYFIAKAIDQVRPGGVIAFLTSKGTMDKQSPEVRRYIAQRAELLGAVRLPNNAFKANAGTEVTSDILFLQKREQPIDIEPDWVHLGMTGDGVPVNSYFVEHPEMLLGKMVWADSMYGSRQETACLPIEGAELGRQLSEALQNISGQIAPAQLPDLGESAQRDTLPADPNVPNYAYAVIGSEIYYRENSVMVRPEVRPTAKERIRGMVRLRDCVRKLIDDQMEDAPDEIIQKTQAQLSGLYDAYTAKYGLINSRGNASAFSGDSSYYLLCSLEVLDENGALARKADMFTKRTIRPSRVAEHVDTAAEALALSIAERARVDMAYMAKVSGKTRDELASDLRGVIFRLPESAGSEPRYVTADEYLSGNVRSKLALARQAAEADEGFAPNVAALEQAMPRDLDASEIEVRLGATWIEPRYIQQFMLELLEPPIGARYRLKVNFSDVTAEWNIAGKSRIPYHDVAAYATYGTSRASAYEILESTLNLRDVRIYDTVRDLDGKESRVLNPRETTLAQQKQQALKDAFRDWVWRDPIRRQELTQRYNQLFNSTRPREFSGEHITFSGMNPEIRLRPHQRDAIAHILYGGNTLLAHEVGAGKTFEMVAACMESKRLGLCHKALFAVPNHLTEQWASEFLRLYPSANILVATKKDFETKNRKKFCARIATGDYDAVIIGHSQFEKIPVSRERQERMLNEQIAVIQEGIAEMKAAHAERFTIKQMERSKKQLEARLNKLLNQERKDDVVTFEQLGVDRLYVDEAHSYKNLFLYTKMRNVAGLSATDAQKSSDMYLKCRYMDELTGSRGTVFATGTPVSNSMTELYTMMRYLQHDTLREKGLSHFDCWASTFGETVTAIELAPEGTGYRARTRFAKFFNLPELMNMFREAADVKTADQLRLPTPEAVYHNVVAKPTDIQKEMVQELSKRAAAVHEKRVDPKTDNMLKITSDGRKLGLDQRILNPLLPDDPRSKVNLCVENIVRVWREGEAEKLTQLVFSDLSTPMGDGSFTVYEDIRRKLVERGIPENEIAFIHTADTETRKKELFAKVRAGQVRVLMGSTSKMGAGTNVQDRLAALHDLDCPWRPGDLEQRKGRIVRQGNRLKTVHIYRYVTEETFDAYLWQTIENKQKFISQIMTSKSPVRACDDLDETALSYAEIKALCAGNPLIKEKMNLDVEVARLRLLKANHQSLRFQMEDRVLKYFPAELEKSRAQAAGFEADIAVRDAHPLPNEGFIGMEVCGRAFADKEEAGKAILSACKSVKDLQRVEIGQYRGFRMSLELSNFGKDYVLTLRGRMAHSLVLGSDPRGNIQRIDNALSSMEQRLQTAREQIDNLEQQQEAAKQEADKPFPQEDELRLKSARLTELDALLDIGGSAPEAMPEPEAEACEEDPEQEEADRLNDGLTLKERLAREREAEIPGARKERDAWEASR